MIWWSTFTHSSKSCKERMGYKFPLALVPSEARKHLVSTIKGRSTSASPPAQQHQSQLRLLLPSGTPWAWSTTEVIAQAIAPSATEKINNLMWSWVWQLPLQILRAAGSRRREGCPVLQRGRRQRHRTAPRSPGDPTAKPFSVPARGAQRAGTMPPASKVQPPDPDGLVLPPCPDPRFQPCLLPSDLPFIPHLCLQTHH